MDEVTASAAVGDPSAAGASSRRYSAFISYNHRDRAWATWLHRNLERYRIPKALRGRPSALGPLGARLPPVFRDREELAASSDLALSIERALSRSAHLIVLCSPNSARSRWVNEEVLRFVNWGRRDRIHCLVVGEDGSTAGADAGMFFPPALLTDGVEPLAADLRREADGRRGALLKVLAAVLEVNYDDLRQRELARRNRRLVALASAGVAGTVLTSGLAAVALVSRNEAIHQRDIARQKALTAERTTDFVKGLFEVNDPSEAKGAKVTALEVLDRGSRQIDRALTTEPNVRAELSTTLSEVYLGLGFYRRADALIRTSLGWKVDDAVTRARQMLILGDAQARAAAYAPAVRSYTAALAFGERADDSTGIVGRILVGRAEALSALERFDDARRDVSRAYARDRKQFGARSVEVARDLEAAGLNADFASQYDRARGYYERALAIRLKLQGAAHPRVSEDLNELGSLAYFQRRSDEAEAYWTRALRSDEVVLGRDHPDVGATLANLARLKLERRAFAEAIPLLRRSVAINLAQRDDTHDDLAFIFANLAIAERGQGHLTEAEGLFERALRAANIHGHRNRAPIMTDLAELLCTQRRFDRAIALLDEAEPLMQRTYPDDPWRVAWTRNVRGGCLLDMGQRDKAAALLRDSGGVIAARWPPQSLYGAAAAARARRLGAGA